MSDDIQLRRGTASEWTTVNPILKAGEPGLETDTREIKYGDGESTWSDLSYATGGDAGSTDQEIVRDTIAAALAGSTYVTVTPNDGADTITITVTGLDDSAVAPVTPNDQTGTTYTFVLNDKHRLVTGNNASSQTFTIPPHSSVAYPVGTALQVYQKGAGTITIAGGSGVTLRTPRGAKTAIQYGLAQAVQVASDVWVIAGDVTT